MFVAKKRRKKSWVFGVWKMIPLSICYLDRKESKDLLGKEYALFAIQTLCFENFIYGAQLCKKFDFLGFVDSSCTRV